MECNNNIAEMVGKSNISFSENMIEDAQLMEKIGSCTSGTLLSFCMSAKLVHIKWVHCHHCMVEEETASRYEG
jgi:hypothetical protein